MSTRSNKRTVGLLLLVVCGMFGFGFAMVPLYSVFCELTGLNGKTGVVRADELDGVVDTSREITVEFLGTVNSAMSLDFRPVKTRMRVHPGQIYEVSYNAKNASDKATVGQAVPSVTPMVASKYFSKTECFCFTRQRFESGEGRDMPVRFVVGKDLPPDVSTITLSYTFFQIDDES